MRHLLILAAAAFLAVGCAGRNEDETGAAPDRGNATVTATDSASVKMLCAFYHYQPLGPFIAASAVRVGTSFVDPLPFAERFFAPLSACIPLPAGLDPLVAAAGAETTTTAHLLLHDFIFEIAYTQGSCRVWPPCFRNQYLSHWSWPIAHPLHSGYQILKVFFQVLSILFFVYSIYLYL